MKGIEEIITENMGLVHNAAQKFMNSYAPSPLYEYEDYLQEGCIGLFNAAKTYRPDKGYTFSTYATNCINNSLKNFVNKRKYRGRSSVSVVSLEDYMEDSTTQAGLYNSAITIDQEALTKYRDLISSMQLSPRKLNAYNTGFNLIELYLQGYTFTEAAKMLDISSSVKEFSLKKVRAFFRYNNVEKELQIC